MSMSLLSTKIILPPLQTGHIDRQRLRHLIPLRPDVRLVLISAPAGFGKTSCLLEWCHHSMQNGARVIWYALDKLDNDPVRLASHLGSAIQIALVCGTDKLDRLGTIGSLDDIVSRVTNELANQVQSYLLALDDYHLIETPEIHATFSLLLEHLPANVQLAIASRADPPLQLSRLRARGHIVELRASELRFTPTEIADFFHHTLGVLLSKTQTEQLDQASDGWAAALRLMILSLQDAHQPVDDTAIDRLLNRYSAAQQHIFDYFADEVFAQQTETIRQFLLDTCILNQLTPDLCGILTGDCAAPLILNRLVQGNLFLISLSDSEPVYRYHHLAEEFLRQRLQLENPEHFAELHRAAADWHEAHGEWVEAVQHALASKDTDYAVWLIETHAWEALTSRGEIMTILNWLTYFSESALKQYPRLCLYFSRSLYLVGDLERSEAYVRLATETLHHGETHLQEQQALQAIAANYQATLAAYRGDLETAQTGIEQAVALQHTVGDLDRVRIANAQAFLHYLRGEVPAAREAYNDALGLAQRIHHHYLTLDAHYYLAQIDLLAAELGLVRERCEALLAQYTTPIGPLGVIMLPLAQALFQQNEVVEAELLLHNALALARRSHIPDVLWYANLLLADMLLARGNTAEAEACILQAQAQARSYHSTMIDAFISAAEARLMLQCGQLEAAGEWASRYQVAARACYHQDYENLTLVRVWFAQRNYEQAQDLLVPLVTEAQSAGRVGTVIAAEAQHALIHLAVGEMDMALNALQRSLLLAHAHGFVRVFLDAGQPMLRLLQHALERGIAPEWVRFLLNSAARADATQHPADTLTEREIEVLQYIAKGASNHDIATALVLSLGTVKSHIHHIMDKLSAQNRTEAVARARNLSLLSD
jgi:LuxR family transcriptional regulator, maltose regulon positive regulatory protein